MSLDPRATAADIPVEEAASRLGLPLDMLIRRINEGTLPARRVDGPDGVHYRVAASGVTPASDLRAGPPPAVPDLRGGALWPRAPHGDTAQPSGAGAPPGERRDVGAAAEVLGRPAPGPGKDPAPSSVPGSTVRPSATEAAVTDPEPVDRMALPIEAEPQAPGGAVGMDARELIGALLSRWEHAHERRIDAEYRLRHDQAMAASNARVSRAEAALEQTAHALAELTATRARELEEHRQALAQRDRDLDALRGQLQTRLAAILERDRVIADREQQILVRERLVAELRREHDERAAAEAGRAGTPRARRRGGMFGGR